MRERPDWDQYLMGLAWAARARSTDEQTRHGAVISDNRHRLLSLGYNSFCHGLRDRELPATRPDKYPWMFHAEQNALANCLIRPEGATIHVTGKVCFRCLQQLWQHGIARVVQLDRPGWQNDAQEEQQRQIFLEMTGMQVATLPLDLSWLEEIARENHDRKGTRNP